ncbi:MAG: 2-succinyl-5-enolpyruvyl-6-hydroxy-3-cyclohexene-1-carboxylate synthase [Bacteroidia bacterium]|jgi:2-succinyl-5-enolpyruvyl-6-hydroxy-3-cyclohexene-1-carboxylate synthase
MSNLSHCLHAFVSKFLYYGVKHVVISPGSRNFPLIKTFIAANKFVELHSVVDERAAGFVALGLAQQTNTPVVVCTTSGTASLNLYPAIAEAFYSQTPLVILTADRPASAIDNWEGQCIRQMNVFDNHILESYQTPESVDTIYEFEDVATNAIQLAVVQHGPVHINMPFEEPFYSDWSEQKFSGVEKKTIQEKFDPIPQAFQYDVKKAKNILWLNGASRTTEVYEYPSNLVVWSDVISNKNKTTNLWENLLFSQDSITLSKPDLIVTTGQYFVSKPLRSYLRSVKGLSHWHINDGAEIPTPFETKPNTMHCEVTEVLKTVSQNYRSTDFYNAIQKADLHLNNEQLLMRWDDFSEFSALRKVYKELPSESILHIANSMPIRYLAMLPIREDLVHAANRGTSGIDGCTSTAVGYAMATKKPVYLFTGDLAFLYDINGLWQKHMPENLRIVVFNNNGGGIFELIDGPVEHKETLPYQTTDHNRSIADMAKHFDFHYQLADSFVGLEKSLKMLLDSPKQVILEVKTERRLNKSFLNSYKHAMKRAIANDK